MQRPRLTQRTAEALTELLPSFRSAADNRASLYPSTLDQSKRAIEYLEDLLRWHRAKAADEDASLA